MYVYVNAYIYYGLRVETKEMNITVQRSDIVDSINCTLEYYIKLITAHGIMLTVM